MTEGNAPTMTIKTTSDTGLYFFFVSFPNMYSSHVHTSASVSFTTPEYLPQFLEIIRIPYFSPSRLIDHVIPSFQSLLTNDWVAVPAEAPGHLVVFGSVLVRALLLVNEAGVLVSLAT